MMWVALLYDRRPRTERPIWENSWDSTHEISLSRKLATRKAMLLVVGGDLPDEPRSDAKWVSGDF